MCSIYRGGKNEKIGVSELRKIQLEILYVTVEFCAKNDINYWLDCGTLLGAIRHKGYIPWDDDIDIGMLRPDYDEFMTLFNEHSSKYRFYSIENNSDFCYAYGKVLDTDTLLCENGNKISINIDVFVYDNVPNYKELEKMYKKRDVLRFLHNLRMCNSNQNSNFVRRFVRVIVEKILTIFPKNYFMRAIVKNSKKYSSVSTKYVGNFTAYAKMICEKSVFSDFITAEFEGKQYKIPIGYDEWLKAFYGDYMELPPVEKGCRTVLLKRIHYNYKRHMIMKTLTFGVFDYFHYGHLKLLERAKQKGDYLIASVQKDE